MQKHFTITRRRLELFASTNNLRGRIYRHRAPVRLSTFAAPGRISFAEAVRGRYRPAKVGQQFRPLWSTHWVKVDLTIPRDWQGQEVHFLWDSTSEACVWIDGTPQQGLTGSDVAGMKPTRPQFILTRRARGGERLTFHLEVAINHLFGASQGDPSAAVNTTTMGLLRQAEIAVFDRSAWDLLWDYVIVSDMALHLPADSPRAGQALWTANAMVNAIDLDNPATWPAARRLAREFLRARNGDSQHNISAIGHAHIDTAWLWPLAETKRKCYRTFASALRYMQDDPSYRFVCSQAQQYAWMKTEQPALYAKLKRAVRAGKFIPAGGTWVEPDCNIPSGESLVRQFLHGQRFFQKEFGVTCREFWNPDVFGYNGQLPQIMRGAGIDYFLTQKLSWNQFNKPAAHTFWWEGIDGSRVLTHFPPTDTYNAMANVKETLFHVANYKDHERSNESYLLFGFGDGGGGPTLDMLEQLRRMRDTDGLPRVQQRSPREFFRRLEADARTLTTQVGELYFELHRGTYTSQARNKRDNRRSELLLRDVELLGAVAAATTRGHRYPKQELDRLWELVLLNQFHDIIPGSSITEVYRDSAAHYDDILKSAGKLRDAAVKTLENERPREPLRVRAINTLSFPRREVVDVNGKPTVVTAPSMGSAVVDSPATSSSEVVSIRDEKHRLTLENHFVRAVFRRDGHLVSLFDKRAKRESIVRGKPGNHFVMFDDEPNNWDAWDVDVYHLEKRYEVAGANRCRVVERNPLRVTLEFQYALSNTSTLRQRVSLSATSARLDFANVVDWNERHRFLKVEFPTALHAEQATYEIQFGSVERPTHFNTSHDIARFEVSAHRWADLSEPDFGLALLNDCKYGYAVHRNVMRLSLLRSPKNPDPQADIGRHEFRYALFSHPGDHRAGGVVAEGLRFNVPLLTTRTRAAAGEQSWFTVDQPFAVIDTVKRAEDSDAIIVRLYEAHGTRGRVRLASTLPFRRATRCNLLERDDQRLPWRNGATTIEMKPFEIVTLKLSR